MKIYETSDLYFAAFLKVSCVPFKGVDRGHEDKRKTVFVFESPEKTVIEDLKAAYFLDTAKVSPLSYAQAVRQMKSLILR